MSSAPRAGGWRAETLQDAVAGIIPVDRALHLVGIRTGPALVEATQALDDAATAYRTGDQATALATAADLAEEIRRARAPGRGTAA